jgi:hypothetical protein
MVMNVEKVLGRLVKREGMYIDEVTKRRGSAQYVATLLIEGVAAKMVLLLNAPHFELRELVVDRDGNVVLHPEVLGEMRVERGHLMAAVDKFNEKGRGTLIDVLVL